MPELMPDGFEPSRANRVALWDQCASNTGRWFRLTPVEVRELGSTADALRSNASSAARHRGLRSSAMKDRDVRGGMYVRFLGVAQDPLPLD